MNRTLEEILDANQRYAEQFGDKAREGGVIRAEDPNSSFEEK